MFPSENSIKCPWCLALRWAWAHGAPNQKDLYDHVSSGRSLGWRLLITLFSFLSNTIIELRMNGGIIKKGSSGEALESIKQLLWSSCKRVCKGLTSGGLHTSWRLSYEQMKRMSAAISKLLQFSPSIHVAPAWWQTEGSRLCQCLPGTLNTNMNGFVEMSKWHQSLAPLLQRKGKTWSSRSSCQSKWLLPYFRQLASHGLQMQLTVTDVVSEKCSCCCSVGNTVNTVKRNQREVLYHETQMMLLFTFPQIQLKQQMWFQVTKGWKNHSP